jgi:hypothetical protein
MSSPPKWGISVEAGGQGFIRTTPVGCANCDTSPRRDHARIGPSRRAGNSSDIARNVVIGGLAAGSLIRMRKHALPTCTLGGSCRLEYAYP